MRTAAVLLIAAFAAALVACGGEPFTLATETSQPYTAPPLAMASPPAQDAGHDVAVEVDATPDTSAAVGRDAALDTALEGAAADAADLDAQDAQGAQDAQDAAAADVAPACTPFGVNVLYASGDCHDYQVQAPNFMIENHNTCGGATAPAACRCRETFTCECLAAAGACGSMQWVGCTLTAGQAPTVACR